MQLLIFSVCDTGQICLILIFFAQSGVKIREHKFLTGHKFTNLIKSVSLFMTIIHSKGNFSLVSLLKHQNEKLFLKKFQNLFNSHIFSSCMQLVQPFWVWIEKIIIPTIFAASKIQTIRKLNNPTTTLITGLFLAIVRFNWLKS